jgi:hypothetical protein
MVTECGDKATGPNTWQEAMKISEKALNDVRLYLDRQIVLEDSKLNPFMRELSVLLGGGTAEKLVAKNNPEYAQILTRPEAEQRELLMAAFSVLAEAGTNFVTEKLSVKERVKLMFDAIFYGASKDFIQELLGAALKRTLQSLKTQAIDYRAIYFGLADTDTENIKRCIAKFPQLAPFSIAYVPPMGQMLNVISNLPLILSERYNLILPPFVNQALCTQQIDEDTLYHVLDEAGKGDFNLYWSTLVIWDIQAGGVPMAQTRAAKIDEPHSMPSSVVLNTDLLPKGSPPICKFITANIIDSAELSLCNMGVEFSRETGIQFK